MSILPFRRDAATAADPTVTPPSAAVDVGKLENGWLRLTPDVGRGFFTAVARCRGAVLWTVIEQTWGVAWWTRAAAGEPPPDSDPVRLNTAALADACGLTANRLGEARRDMIRERILIEYADGSVLPNKRYDEWGTFDDNPKFAAWVAAGARAMDEARAAAERPARTRVSALRRKVTTPVGVDNATPHTPVGVDNATPHTPVGVDNATPHTPVGVDKPTETTPIGVGGRPTATPIGVGMGTPIGVENDPETGGLIGKSFNSRENSPPNPPAGGPAGGLSFEGASRRPTGRLRDLGPPDGPGVLKAGADGDGTARPVEYPPAADEPFAGEDPGAALTPRAVPPEVAALVGRAADVFGPGHPITEVLGSAWPHYPNLKAVAESLVQCQVRKIADAQYFMGCYRNISARLDAKAPPPAAAAGPAPPPPPAARDRSAAEDMAHIVAANENASRAFREAMDAPFTAEELAAAEEVGRRMRAGTGTLTLALPNGTAGGCRR